LVLKKEKAEKRQDLFILIFYAYSEEQRLLPFNRLLPTMSGKQQDAKLDMPLCTSPSAPFYAHIREDVD
jgi:hypothetical protein